MRRALLALLQLILPCVLWAQGNRTIIPNNGLTCTAISCTIVAPLLTPNGTAALPAVGPAANPAMGFFFDPATFYAAFAYNNVRYVQFGATGLGLKSNTWIFWSSGEPGLAIADLFLKRAAANTLLQENGDTPQAARLSAGFSGYEERGSAVEEITLATGATTTDSSANLLPANAVIEAVVYRVTQTITTAANYSIGDATTAARFVSGATGLTAGTTGTGLIHLQGNTTTQAAGPTQAAAAKIRITTNVNPGAGKIRIQVYYRVFGMPAT
jgi:hypothetical protein